MKLRSESDREAAAALWRAAWNNMPPRRSKKMKNWGKFRALAILLGYKLVAPNGSSIGHHAVYDNWMRGSVPRNPEVYRRLRIFAGPFGTAVAYSELKQLGIAQRYDWPWDEA